MALRKPRLSPVYLLTIVVLACTGVVVWSNQPWGDGFQALRARAATTSGRPLLVVAFQEGDCESNLEFLSVLERPEFTGRVAVMALFSGTRGQLDPVVEGLESRYPGARFELAAPRDRQLLSLLGHPATPYWVLLDASGAVRLSAPAPSTSRAYAAFAESLQLHLRAGDRT
jgi:hypothetical protein